MEKENLTERERKRVRGDGGIEKEGERGERGRERGREGEGG